MLGRPFAVKGAVTDVVTTRRALQLRQSKVLRFANFGPARAVVAPSQRGQDFPFGIREAQVCGQPGTPPCDEGVPQSSLQGLGFWPFTSAPAETLTPEQTAIQLNLAAGQDTLRDTYNRSVGADPAVTEGTGRGEGFFSYLASKVPDTLAPDKDKLADTIKTVAIAGAVIAGALVLVPIVTEAAGWSHLFRKVVS